MEHSRLLKFFTEERNKTNMAEPSTKPESSVNPSISSSVPGTQEIREADPNTPTIETMDNNYVITETETFAPVLTVTKNETTLTKGDLTMKKITVTEDISVQEMENGHSISYTELQRSVVTNKHTTISEGSWVKGSEEKNHEKKSKIPKLKFKQTIEKVKEKRREEKAIEQAKKIPRRSSIPKLKDSKLFKRNISLDTDTRSGATSLDFEPRIEDEFDKIYEEIVDNKENDIDDKIIAVQIDDPEKIETKFEEIINAYDSNDDNYLTQTEKLRLSKIPWRKKDDGTRFGSIVEKVKSKSYAANTELRDGGFKVLSSTIKTKRFSRGNSTDMNVDIAESFDSRNGEGIKTKLIHTESTDKISLDIENKANNEINNANNKREANPSVKKVESSPIAIKETTARQFKSGIPVKPERISRSISKDLNRRPPSLADRDMVNREVIKHEEIIDGNTKTIITETISKEIPVSNERISRGISRTFSRDGKSVTVSPKLKEISSKDNKSVVLESTETVSNVSTSKDTKESIIDVKMTIKNGDPTTDDPKDNNETENNTQEAFVYGSNKTIIRKTFTEEIPLSQEKVTRSISRTFSRDGKSVTLSPKQKYTTQNNTPFGDSTTNLNKESDNNDLNKGSKKPISDRIETNDNIEQKQATDITKDKPENISNDRVKKEVSPTIKTTHSFSKGQIKHIEISKTIEWKSADEIKTSHTVNKLIDDREFATCIAEREEKQSQTVTKTNDVTTDIVNIAPLINEVDNNNTLLDIPAEHNEASLVSPTDNSLEEKKKESSLENVTILKGNVIRKISQISVKEDKDDSKKVIDVEKDLPKKKSVLSKIAMFEGKEPENFSITIKKCVINKRSHMAIATENDDEKTKVESQVIKPQFKDFDDNDTNKSEITKSDEIKTNYRDEPVIVDQIWKVQQQTTENVAKIQQTEDIRIIPETLDATTIESNAFAKIEHEIKTEVKVIKMLPSEIKSSKDKKLDEVINNNKLPVQTPELNIPPANELENKEVLTEHNNIKIEKSVHDNSERVTEDKPTKVGKLDLNFWQKQVEINKQFIGTDKPIVFTPKHLSDENIYEKDLNKTEIPTILSPKFEIKTDKQVEIPTILPGGSKLANKYDANEKHISKIPKKIELTSNDKLQVPVILPDTPLIKSSKTSFETQRSQVEVPVILPSKIEFSANKDIAKPPEYISDKVDLTSKINKPTTPTLHTTEQVKPEEVVYETQKPDYVNENKTETTKTLPDKIKQSSYTNIDYISKTPPGKLDLSKYIKTPEIPKTGKSNVFEKSFQVERTIEKSKVEDIEHNTTVIQLTKANESKIEHTIILPGKLDTNSNINANNEEKHEPIAQLENEDVEKILPAKTERSTHIDIGIICKQSPGKQDLSKYVKTSESFKVLPGKVNVFEKFPKVETTFDKSKLQEIEQNNTTVIQLNEANENNFEDTKTLLDKLATNTNINYNTKEIQKPINLLESETLEKENLEKILPAEIEPSSKITPGKLDLSKYIKTPQSSAVLHSKINVFEKSFQVQRTSEISKPEEIKHKTVANMDQANKDKKKETSISLDRLDINSNINDNNIEKHEPITLFESKTSKHEEAEILSDPELVDSESETKDTKETIMGKLKNKVYFIASLNIAKKAHEQKVYENKDSSSENLDENSNLNNETESFIKENKGYSSLPYIDNTKRDFDSKSDVGTEKSDFNSKKDFKRAKSLAELDVGDVVKGQVQRMVYRIKSVDFDRIETPKRKISLKEMPRKRSVLEKIALFEGKAASNSSTTLSTSSTSTTERSPKPTLSDCLPQDTTTSPMNVSTTTTMSPETIYLRKVEDLSTAKVRYGKTEMLYLKLSNGMQMPVIALGTALMDNRLLPHIVSAAIDLGYRAIDTAYIYGNEKEVGQGIKAKIDDGTVKREDLFIMSKLWSTFHDPALVEPACRASLDALGLEYFDLYMIHNPMSLKEGGDAIPKIASVLQFSEFDYLDAWFAMESLLAKGLVKSIGVSNFNSSQIQRILDKGRVKPVVNQVECSPYLSQKRLQAFCDERNITLSCFSVLGSKGTPKEFKNHVDAVIDDPLVQVMASGLNVTAAQLLVRYQIQSGRNAVVKSSSASHLWDVLQAVTFQMKQHEIDALNALNRNKRVFTFKGMGDAHKNYPFKEGF